LRKCPYCDFSSHTLKARLPEQDYVTALLKDLRNDLDLVRKRTLGSIFIGGGTPSLMSAEAIHQLLHEVFEEIAFDPKGEITLEANPGAVELGDLSGYRQAGVNRISLGIQSLNKVSLQMLGRIHDPREAFNAVAVAKQAGFEAVNLDLMFGLPLQSPEMACEDLERVLTLAPEHISYYQLTQEPNTVFYHHPPPLPDEDAIWQMQQQGHERLEQAGFQRYEISAFARPGAQCQHNLNYWRFGDYLGIGAGAHGKLTRPDGQAMRFWKRRHPEEYLAATATASWLQGSKKLNQADLVLEFMINALRLTEGVTLKQFEATTGLTLSDIETPLKQAVEKGLLNHVESRLQATPLGLRFLNDLLMLFEVNAVC
jgi:oxygen-independent coproporphyrinogen-3 oxidase